MAEAFGTVASALTVIEVTVKLIDQIKSLIETHKDAPKDLQRILLEVSCLKATLETFDFLSGQEFSDNVQNLTSPGGLLQECQSTVEELGRLLDSLSLVNTSQAGQSKRQKIIGTIEWHSKEKKARKLLAEMTRCKETLSVALLGEIAGDVKKIMTTTKRIDDHLSQSERREICNWLEHTNPTSNHNRARRLQEVQTCQWIHRVKQWDDWLHCQRRMVWIHGIPGAGKTVLASYLVEQTIAHCKSLGNKSQVGCWYYYCSFLHGQAGKRDESLPFLRWIVSQLCRHSQHIPASVLSLHQQNSTPSYKELKAALQELLEPFKTIYIAIDAVDESNPRNELLRLLEEFMTDPSFAKIQLLVTSRREGDIESALGPLCEPTLPLSNSVIDEDIRLYVANELVSNSHFSYWSEDLRNKIEEALVKGAQGMFRWVICQIHRLERKSQHEAKEALRCLPETIEASYELIFLEIPQESRDKALTALQWIIGDEDLDLDHGIPADCLNAATLDHRHADYVCGADNCVQHELFKEILGCLIEVSATSAFFAHLKYAPKYTCAHKVTLAHYTIQEYLFSERIRASEVSHFAMSREACARKMLETAFQRYTKRVESNFPETHNTSAFYYAMVVLKGSVDWEDILILDDVFWHSCLAFFGHYRFIWTDLHGRIGGTLNEYEFLKTDESTRIKIQFLVASWDRGLARTSIKLLNECAENIDVSILAACGVHASFNETYEQNRVRSTPLLRACSGEDDFLGGSTMTEPYFKMFEVLQSKFAPSDLLPFYLESHYHEHRCRRFCVIDKILSRCTSVDLRRSSLPLQIAVWTSDYAAVKSLLESGVDPNHVGRSDGKNLRYFEEKWMSASPLHIQYNHDFDSSRSKLCQYDESGPEWEERLRNKPAIEKLLLQHGARDFIQPDLPEDLLDEMQAHHLTN